MKQRCLGFKFIATIVIVSLQALMIPAIAANPASSVNGSIISADSDAPLAGAKLHLGDPMTGEVYTSEPADQDGNFEMTDVPPSTYEVAVESNGGLYLVQSPLQLAPGQSQPVNVAINPQMADDPETEEKKKKKQGGTGVWNNPATAALIVVGAAVVLGLLINAATDDDDDQSSSPN
jgi:hypothetical protein